MKKIDFLLLLIIFLTGCATISYLPSSSRTSTPTTSVEVLWEKPQKLYIELGQVTVESSSHTDEQLFEKLKQKAMQIGADAIIVKSTIPYATAPRGSWLFVSGKTVRRLEALAIKYKQN